PLDRRGCREVCRTGSAPRQRLRHHPARSARLWARAEGGSVAAFRTSAGIGGDLPHHPFAQAARDRAHRLFHPRFFLCFSHPAARRSGRHGRARGIRRVGHPGEIRRKGALHLPLRALGGEMSEKEKRAPGRVKEVTSVSNPLVKDIKSLALKKYRDREHAFMAEGLKLVLDAFENGWTIRTLVYAKAGRGNALVEKAAARTV